MVKTWKIADVATLVVEPVGDFEMVLGALKAPGDDLWIIGNLTRQVGDNDKIVDLCRFLNAKVAPGPMDVLASGRNDGEHLPAPPTDRERLEASAIRVQLSPKNIDYLAGLPDYACVESPIGRLTLSWGDPRWMSAPVRDNSMTALFNWSEAHGIVGNIVRSGSVSGMFGGIFNRRWGIYVQRGVYVVYTRGNEMDDVIDVRVRKWEE